MTDRQTDRQTDGRTDGRTDGQNYDSQDRASIAASRGKKQMKMKLQRGNKKGFSKPAPGRSSLCGGYIGKDSPGNEEASSSCCNETSKDFEITTGASKG